MLTVKIGDIINVLAAIIANIDQKECRYKVTPIGTAQDQGEDYTWYRCQFYERTIVKELVMVIDIVVPATGSVEEDLYQQALELSFIIEILVDFVCLYPCCYLLLLTLKQYERQGYQSLSSADYEIIISHVAMATLELTEIQDEIDNLISSSVKKIS